MKIPWVIFYFAWTLSAVGLAVWLVFEHRALSKLDQENNALRQQLVQSDEVLEENQRLSNLVAKASRPLQMNDSQSHLNERVDSPSRRDEQTRELVRLRREVSALREENQKIESLRADTRQLRAARENQELDQAARSGTNANGSQLEILRAHYGTDHTNIDVTEELNERIRSDTLKAVASNNIKGDPEFGQVKYLTVVYRFGSVIWTNDFREGDLVIIPKE